MSTYPDIRPWLGTFTTDSINAMAGRLGLTTGNFNKQAKGEANMPPETIVKIARTYGVSPLPGLVEQGLLTAEEVRDELDKLSVEMALTRCSDDQLIREVKRRLDANRDAYNKAQMQAQAQGSQAQFTQAAR